MERPRGEKQPIERRLTAETMYLHDRWRNGQLAGEYAALSAIARQMYEEDAAVLTNLGGEAAILDLFDRYDTRPQLSYSCEALATEILKFKDRYSDGHYESFDVSLLPWQVIDKLRALRVGSLLAGDEDQLALPSGPNGDSTLDIRKKDATPTDVSLRVWKYAADRKYAVTSDPEIEPQFPRDYLMYPSDETSYQYLMEVILEYYHPTADIIQETIGLYIGKRGQLGVERDMYITGFGAAASEGCYVQSLPDASEQDIAAFADVIAEIVGDVPTPKFSHDEYNDIKDYIRRISNGLTRAYLTEWLDNTSRFHVNSQLSASRIDGTTLRDALVSSNNSSAHDELVSLIDYEREIHNAYIQATSPDGGQGMLWRDRIAR